MGERKAPKIKLDFAPWRKPRGEGKGTNTLIYAYLTEEEKAQLDEARAKVEKDIKARNHEEPSEESAKREKENTTAFRLLHGEMLKIAKERRKEFLEKDPERIIQEAKETIAAVDTLSFDVCIAARKMAYLTTLADKQRTTEEELKELKERARDYDDIAEIVINESLQELKEIYLKLSKLKIAETLENWDAAVLPFKAKKKEKLVKRAEKEAESIQIKYFGGPLGQAPIIKKPDKIKFIISYAYDNLLQANLNFLKLRPDGQHNIVFEARQNGVELEESKTVKPVKGRPYTVTATSVIYITTVGGAPLTKELLKIDDTDITIFTHIITLIAAGNMEMTAEQIYASMTHGKSRITSYWEKRIDLTFKRLEARKLGIIYKDLIDQHIIEDKPGLAESFYKGESEEQILVYGKEDYLTNRGTKKTKYIIRDLPFIYLYSDARDLILSVNAELMEAGIEGASNTEDTINLRHNLILRIEKMKRKKEQRKKLDISDRTILLDTLFEKSLSLFELEEQSAGSYEAKETYITRKKKDALLVDLAAILSDLTDRKEINGYILDREMKGRGRPYERIIIEI